jgi:uncharacterized lipoprotein YbaY
MAGCSALPEQGPPTQTLRGTLTFREVTAMPPTATAHISIVPISAASDASAVAHAEVPAKTGSAIPFTIKFPAEKITSGGDYFVLAQVVDHGKVWYSNLTTPLRINFTAEPGDLVIELRPERR